MKTATITLKGTSPYSQSRYVQEKKKAKETHDDFEKRTWRQRMHVDKDGFVVLPGTAIKNGLVDANKYRPIQVPGAGKTTYTKYFEAGVLPPPAVRLMDAKGKPIKAADVPGEWLYVPSDGKRGGTRRVPKCFPRVDEWSITVEVMILDDMISEEIFEQVLTELGNFIGFGRFRPRNNGYYGRFVVEKIEWS